MWKNFDPPSEVFIVLYIRPHGIEHEVHARLAIQRFFDTNRLFRAIFIVDIVGLHLRRVFHLFGNCFALLPGSSLFFGSVTRKLNEFDTRRAKRMGPINRALGL